MLRSEYLRTRKDKAIETATQILSRSIDPILGIREINAIRFDFEDIEAFEPFIALESETDHFVRGEVRKNFGAELLARLDLELEEFLKDCNAEIDEACLELIKALTVREAEIDNIDDK